MAIGRGVGRAVQAIQIQEGMDFAGLVDHSIVVIVQPVGLDEVRAADALETETVLEVICFEPAAG